MKHILVIINKIFYRIIWREWITAPKCERVPVYVVEDARVRIVSRGIIVVERHDES